MKITEKQKERGKATILFYSFELGNQLNIFQERKPSSRILGVF